MAFAGRYRETQRGGGFGSGAASTTGPSGNMVRISLWLCRVYRVSSDFFCPHKQRMRYKTWKMN